jgi:hypothetical protein
MAQESHTAEPEDGIREFAIPIEGTRGQKVILKGRIRTKLDPATENAIADILADALVADYQEERRRDHAEFGAHPRSPLDGA